MVTQDPTGTARMATSTDWPTLDPAKTYLVFQGVTPLVYEAPSTLTDNVRYNAVENQIKLNSIITKYASPNDLPVYKIGSSAELVNAVLCPMKELYRLLRGWLPVGLCDDHAKLDYLFSELLSPEPVAAPPADTPESDIKTALSCLRRLVARPGRQAERLETYLHAFEREVRLAALGQVVLLTELVASTGGYYNNATYYSAIPDNACARLKEIRKRWKTEATGWQLKFINDEPDVRDPVYGTYADLKAKLAELELRLP
jgi:hypothetical protein